MILTGKQHKNQHYHQVKLIDKYEYLTGEETLPFGKKRVIKQAKFTYSSLCKTFEKQIKTVEDQGEK